MHILVIEDDSASRRLLERFLAPYGTCISAPDGMSALNIFRKSVSEGPAFDLVCLDIMLPDVDGQIVLEGIRFEEEEKGIPRERQVPVFFTSGLDKPAYEEDEELRKKRVAYLLKPIERQRLRTLLNEFDLLHDQA